MRETPSHPFSSEFEHTGFGERIKSLQDRPNVIVRHELTIAAWDKKYLESQLKRFSTSKKLFQEWQNYNINVTNIDTVFSQSEQNSDIEVYLVTERVIGKPMYDLEYSDINSEHLDKAIGDVLTGLVDYHIDKINNQEELIGDIKWEQFIYGHKMNEDDQENALYYVDVEPFFNKYEKGSISQVKSLFGLRNLFGLIQSSVIKRRAYNPDESVPDQWLSAFEKLKHLISTLDRNIPQQHKAIFTYLEQDIVDTEKSLHEIPMKRNTPSNAWGQV